MSETRLYLALIHHPVVNRKGAVIASALTTIDMHDIARASMTFGVRGFYVVTPLEDQKTLAREVIDHWTRGVGGELNPFRKEALELIRVVDTFAQVLAEIRAEGGHPVVTAATSAAPRGKITRIDEVPAMLDQEASVVIAFGTAWGLSPEFIQGCDCLLEPVAGSTEYNHLSVRSAVSIILDRLVNGRGQGRTLPALQ